MQPTGRSVAEKFDFFTGLTFLDRWVFYYRLKWVASNPESLEALLAFERVLAAQNLDDWSRFQAVSGALLWYNREDHDRHLADRLPRERLVDMLRVVCAFLGKSKRLHFRYRELILNILRTGDVVAANPHARFPVTAQWFDGEMTALITTLPAHWGGWDRWEPHLLFMSNQFLDCLEKIAGRISTAELFTLFRQEIPKQWSTGLVKNLDLLSAIAGKVPDAAAFTFVFQQAAPDLGLGAVTALLGIAKDFAEFEDFYWRTSAQVKTWGISYLSLFCKLNSMAQLSWLLDLLETYHASARVARYQEFAQSHRVGMLGKWMTGGLHNNPVYMLDDLTNLHGQGFRNQGRMVGVDDLVDHFEERLIDDCLREIWQACYMGARLRWGFDTFTSYIPYEMREMNWTKDDEKTRSYWNVNDAIGAELKRFFAALRPRLLALFRIIDLDDFDALLDLLPKFLSVEEYLKEVNVPVAWEQGVEYQDGYDKYAGNYTEEVAVARPVRFAPHPFRFERPYLQDVIDLIDHMDKVWHEIQARRNAKLADPA